MLLVEIQINTALGRAIWNTEQNLKCSAIPPQRTYLMGESESHSVVSTLCDPMDYTVHGILQARILEWVDKFPPPGDLPNPGIEPRSSTLQADSLPAEPPGKPSLTGILHVCNVTCAKECV